MKSPRVKETILELWGTGWSVGQIADEMNKSIYYIFAKLKKYGEIPPNW